MDFHDLNKAFHKDDFPLTNIDILVDNTMGYEILSLMDDFSNYNKIWFNLDNQHKIGLTIHWGNFYYKVIYFGLKNASVTYYHAMTYIFYDMMHDIVEDYIDDLLSKFPTWEGYWDVLRRFFQHLLEYNIQLNPKKCIFGIISDKILGFIMYK